MPPSRLLSENPVGSLQALSFLFPDLVVKFGGKKPFITSPAISLPGLAIRLSVVTTNSSQMASTRLPTRAAKWQPGFGG